MNIMDLRKQPHLSASGINDYIDCGLQYKFGRVDHIPPEFVADNLVFGSAIHRVLESFHRAKLLGNRMNLRDLQQEFDAQWRSLAEGKDEIRYSNDKDFESLLREGKDLLAAYWDKFPGDQFQIVGIEESFYFRIPGVPVNVIGVYDLLEEDEAGTLIIVDWKTAGRAYSRDDVDKNLQLTLYQMAARGNGYGDREILLRFDCLIKTKTPKFEQYYTTRSDRDEHRMQRKILEVWKGISKGVFIPNDGHWKCKGCAYQRACEQWFDQK